MDGPSSSPEILAHWRYEPELWRDFIKYESSVYRKSIRSAKYFIGGTVIGAVLLVILVSVVPFLITKKFDSSIWGPAFGICIIAGIFLAVGFFILTLRKQKMARLNTPTGEAVITTNKIVMNAVDFEWNYGASTGWEFLNAERKTVSVTPLKRIEILELRFVTFIPGKNAPHREEAEFRLPVPQGRLSEADNIVASLRRELSSAKQMIV